MRSKAGLVFGAALALLLGAAQVQAQGLFGPEAADSDCCNPTCAYLQVDGLFWTRNVPNDALIVTTATGATVNGDTTNSQSFNWQAAPRVTFGVVFGDPIAVEVSWFGFYDFQLSGTTTPLTAAQAASSSLPFNLAVATPLTTGETESFRYNSKLNSAELNLVHLNGSAVSFMIGFRYLNLTEDFNANLTTAAGAGAGRFAVHTDNNLFGGQVGVNVALPIGERLSISAAGKAGVFEALEDQSTSGSFFNAAGTGPAARNASSTTTAFVGEVGVFAHLRVTNWLTAHAGYDLMWIEGVALAPDQFRASNFATGGAASVNTSGDIFLHGAQAGVEFRF